MLYLPSKAGTARSSPAGDAVRLSKIGFPFRYEAGGFSPAYSLCTEVSDISIDYQINEQIRDREVRMIDENGEQLGIIALAEAMRKMCIRDRFEPIAGLYATGNCCGGRFGFQYTTSIPGQSISIAQTLGREVGYTVAAL